MIDVADLELLLERCRKVGYIEELGMEVPYYDFPAPGEGIRLLPSDLVAVLTGGPFPEYPNRLTYWQLH